MVKGYWVMAQTSSPQFVLARYSVSSLSGVLCLFTALVLVQDWFVRNRLVAHASSFNLAYLGSSYGPSVYWILTVQTMGTIAPVLRWLAASWFKIAETERRSFRDELKVDKYWTLRLEEWRDRPLPFHVQNRACKKILRDVVRFVLNFCIGVQILFVSAGKLVLFISSRFGSASLGCPIKSSRTSATRADRLTCVGEEKQPRNLIQLLKKSSNFKGVGRFDSCHVPSLHSEEPRNCWSMPVVTLTAISVALTKIADEKTNQLLVYVSDGLTIVKLIEETLDGIGESESIRKAADVVWIGVVVYRKWDDMDLKSTRIRGTTHRETLQNLSSIAEKVVTEFIARTKDILMQNPLNWPARVIAANSMYRIAQTILVGMGDDEHQDDDELFESISITISDILAGCLTNLVQVITLKCHTNDIREREKSVRRATILLGESKQILEILQERELPSLDVEKASYIDEWKASMALDIENPPSSASASSSDDATMV
ncbi:uncharacterized protein LOC121784059 [Salvia splendens]|uniref:uncharacterized protein LOC121784059 n=1 Tax=Salvia splendens TaxID=180675 RepID=UPI001C261528|nr:uncharacterized protein LOC121784059 [Salvia splendens]